MASHHAGGLPAPSPPRVERGLFTDVDVALAWHPLDETFVDFEGAQANVQFVVEFRGRTTHAATDPWNGRSTADAVEAFTHGINLLREHVKPTVGAARRLSGAFMTRSSPRDSPKTRGRQRMDMHHHMYTPEALNALRENFGGGGPSALRLGWTLPSHSMPWTAPVCRRRCCPALSRPATTPGPCAPACCASRV